MTFVSWLHDQEQREDSIGWFAQYWAGLGEKPRLSAHESVRKHLNDRHLLSGEGAQPGLAEAFDTALAEYRQQRILNAAGDANATLSDSVARHPSMAVNADLRAFMEQVLNDLYLIKTALGIKDVMHVAPETDKGDLDWQPLWEMAEKPQASGG